MALQHGYVAQLEFRAFGARRGTSPEPAIEDQRQGHAPEHPGTHHGTKKLRTFFKKSIFLFLAFHGSKNGILGQKMVVLSVLDRV